MVYQAFSGILGILPWQTNSMFIIFLISFQNTSYLGIAHGTHHRQAVFYRNTVKISPVSLSMQIVCFCNDIDSWDLGALKTGQWGTNSRGPSLLFCSAAHRAFLCYNTPWAGCRRSRHSLHAHSSDRTLQKSGWSPRCPAPNKVFPKKCSPLNCGIREKRVWPSARHMPKFLRRSNTVSPTLEKSESHLGCHAGMGRTLSVSKQIKR